MKQYEDMCQYIKDNYTADIKLAILANDDHTILNYIGTAATQQGESALVEKKRFVTLYQMRI